MKELKYIGHELVYYVTREESKRFSPRVIFATQAKQEQQNYTR